jgi:hypothetical protein
VGKVGNLEPQLSSLFSPPKKTSHALIKKNHAYSKKVYSQASTGHGKLRIGS